MAADKSEEGEAPEFKYQNQANSDQRPPVLELRSWFSLPLTNGLSITLKASFAQFLKSSGRRATISTAKGFRISFVIPPRKRSAKPSTAVEGGVVDGQAQAKALRLRMYLRCSECARLIDLDDGRGQLRAVETTDLVRHESDNHGSWLGVLGVDEASRSG